MTHVKISVTLEPTVAEELRQIAGPRGQSAFVNEAVRQQLQSLRVRKLLDEMEGESGSVPDTIRREVDALDWPE